MYAYTVKFAPFVYTPGKRLYKALQRGVSPRKRLKFLGY